MTRQSAAIDEDIETFRPQFRRFLEKEFKPHAAEWRRRKAVDPGAWPKLGRFGALLPSMPERYGGSGKSFAFDAAIIEDVEKTVPELTAGIVAQNAIVPYYLLHYASEAQKRRWLPRLATGELTGAIAMTEPGAGSDLRAIGMRAERRGDRFVLNGQKTFITNGNVANLVLVAAKTESAENLRDISMFVVETESCAGFKRGRTLDKMGLPASGVSELFFEDAVVDADCLLGGVAGQGLRQMMEQLPRERLAIAVVAVAAIEQAVDLTVRYAKDRVVFGRPVLEHQANGFSLAEAKTQAVVARVFVDRCVERLVAGELDAVTASMAKLWTTETQMSVVDTCVQLHGGNGYMDEYDISRMFTAARAQKIFGGTNEIMKHLIARSL